MELFVAAVYTNGYRAGGDEKGRYAKLTDYEKEKVDSVKNLLESYHYVCGQRYVDAMRLDGVQVFLDSGAFSAHTLGVSIDLPTYCEYIKRNKDILRVEDGTVMASVLDGIGDPLQTYRNQLCMEELGAKPLPCFHFGEDPRYLEYYVQNYDYITLGGMVGRSTDALVNWLDPLWENYLVDGAGKARLKVHAFGITSFKIMERYPWHCMTEEDHTVLTQEGWKGLKDLKVGELVLCQKEDKSYWSPIKKIHQYKVENEQLCEVFNRNFKANVTKNHRWYYKNKNTNKYEFCKTTDLNSQTILIPRIGDYICNNEKVYSDELCELFGWFWTDGSIKKRKQRGYKNDSIVIYQSYTANYDKYLRLKNVLDKSGEKYCISHVNKKNGSIEATFELYGNISQQILEITNSEKTVPLEFILKMTKNQIKLFIEGSVLADGTDGRLKRRRSFSFTQMKELNIDVFRIACLLAGIPTSKYNSPHLNRWEVNSSSVNSIWGNQIYYKEYDYTGVVWCIEVESGAFYTKNNEKIYVTGNSVDSSSWIQSAAFGSIVTPKFGTISISEKSPSRFTEGRHASNLTQLEQDALFKYLEEQGFTYERLSTVYESRAAYNLWAYGIINQMINATRIESFKRKVVGLFE